MKCLQFAQQDRPPMRLHLYVTDVQITLQHCVVCLFPVDGSRRTVHRTFAGMV